MLVVSCLYSAFFFVLANETHILLQLNKFLSYLILFPEIQKCKGKHKKQLQINTETPKYFILAPSILMRRIYAISNE